MTMNLTTTGAPPALALGLGRSRRLVVVASLAEASALYRSTTDAHLRAGGHGASDFHEGRIYDTTGAAPAVVARVSWNGRVWANKTWAPGDEPLYSPAPATVEGSAQ